MNAGLLWLTLCQGLFLTTNICFVAINGVVGLALAPQAWMATLPVCAYVAGGAVFAPWVARHQQAWGRRRAFQLGALVGMLACAAAAGAVHAQSFGGLIAATLLAGYFNASGSLFRFAAPELVAAEHRERAISWVLAGGLLGAVAGPWLASHSRDWVAAPFAASYLSLVGVALAVGLGVSIIQFPTLPAPVPGASRRSWREMAQADPRFVVAIAACALSYGVMNLLMSATPIAMGQCSLPFEAATQVLQWHVLGMFLPGFFTGHLIRRWGAMPIMAVGLALNVACVAFALSGQDLEHFLGALVVLGVGWNFMFVGGTTLFTQSYRPEDRTLAQSRMDMAIYLTMTLTAFSSGALVTTGGWRFMNLASLIPLALAGLALAWAAFRPRPSCPAPSP
jgi:MFS family permease